MWYSFSVNLYLWKLSQTTLILSFGEPFDKYFIVYFIISHNDAFLIFDGHCSNLPSNILIVSWTEASYLSCVCNNYVYCTIYPTVLQYKFLESLQMISKHTFFSTITVSILVQMTRLCRLKISLSDFIRTLETNFLTWSYWPDLWTPVQSGRKSSSPTCLPGPPPWLSLLARPPATSLPLAPSPSRSLVSLVNANFNGRLVQIQRFDKIKPEIITDETASYL